MKSKDWKDKKKYSQKSNESYFSKRENSPAPPGAVQKKHVNDENLEKEKNWLKNKTKRNGRKKAKKKRTKARNCEKELKRIKKEEKEKANKKELWSKLQELNNNFAKVEEHK